MITLTAKINLLSGDNSALTLASDDLSGNNISSNLSGIVGVKKTCINPFIFGVSKLGSGATFESKESFTKRSGGGYYIGNQPSDESGNFATPYSIVISGSEITNLTIEFDTVNKRHPNSINIDGTTYIDDDAIFTVANLTSSTSHTITIDNWNTANAPLVITGIYVEVSIEIDRRNLISISRSIFDRSDLKLPSFGIISNTGNIEFNDTNGEIRDYAEQLLLQSGLKCEIKLNNTLVDGAIQTIGVFETDEWDYDNDNRVVSVSLKDDLEEWQNINIDKIYVLLEEKSIKDFYDFLIEKSSQYNYVFQPLDEQTEDILTNTICKYPYLEASTLWGSWNKLCEICGLYIWKNNNGEIVVKHKI